MIAAGVNAMSHGRVDAQGLGAKPSPPVPEDAWTSSLNSSSTWVSSIQERGQVELPLELLEKQLQRYQTNTPARQLQAV
ncbi:hypothetical protein ABBQ38_014387 [Trebouxia sp. C0009 RCD-2024]